MAKTVDYNGSLILMDEEVTSLLEKLDSLDPTSDEYEKVAKNLRLVQEAKQIEVRNKNEDLNGKVPAWLTSIIGSAIALVFGGAVMVFEQKGGMIGTSAVNLWDKITRKF